MLKMMLSLQLLGKRSLYLVVFLCIYFIFSFFVVSPLLAQESSTIKVTGYDFNRSSSALLDFDGDPLVHPGGPNSSSTVLGNFLLNPSNFGQNGIVKCSVDLQNPTSYIESGSLINNSGNLLVDVFFATDTIQDLSTEEITELTKFINAGGIVYAHTVSIGGDQYVKLFENLGLDIVFGERQQEPTGSLSSDPDDTTPITNGSFGIIGALEHGPYREIISGDAKIIAYSPTLGTNLLVESSIGNGYLAVASSPLHVNILARNSNIRYFANLVSLGCKEKSNSVVLDVPSFKQGLFPYDGESPLWENLIYDDGDNLDLWCDVNGDYASMAECACALTSASMVMKYFGVEKSPGGQDLNPAILNLYAEEVFPNGGFHGFVNGNFRWDYVGNFSAVANDSFPTQPKIEQPVREDFNVERVKELIDEGKPIILKVLGKWGTHWIVVKGYDPDTNRLIINDPALPDSSGYSYLDENYTPYGTGSMVIYETTNSDYRYLQLATLSPSQLLVIDGQGNKTGYDAGTGQMLTEIPNSSYALDEYYGSPTSESEVAAASEGVYFLTIKLPEDGEFNLQTVNQEVSDPVYIYSSNVEGNVVSKTLTTPDEEEAYNVIYRQENAGESVNLNIDASIDIVPFLKSNIIIPQHYIPIPVAILADEGFDVSKVNKDSLTFGKTGDEESLLSCSKKLLDVNKDGNKDLICYFWWSKTNIGVEDTLGIIKGVYGDDIAFEASDTLHVFVPFWKR